jgi:FkbM family methyltransferase
MVFKRALTAVYRRTIKLFAGSGLYRIGFVRKVNKYLLRQIRNDFVIINGKKLFLDKKDSLGLSVSLDYEPIETDFIAKTVKKDMTVLDVGANIGYYTLLMSDKVGTNGKVFSFEPDPQNQVVLSKNIAVNNLQNVHLEKAAVSSESGTVRLYGTDDKGDQRIYDSHDGRQFVTVPSVSIDDFIEKMKIVKVDFLKMDIQGAEPFAVMGMKKMIKKNPGIILCIEFWPFGLEKCGFGVKQFLDLAKECGLQYFDLNAGGDYNKLADDDELIRTYKAETKAFTNLICFQR